jgi:peroxiredoxin
MKFSSDLPAYHAALFRSFGDRRSGPSISLMRVRATIQSTPGLHPAGREFPEAGTDAVAGIPGSGGIAGPGMRWRGIFRSFHSPSNCGVIRFSASADMKLEVCVQYFRKMAVWALLFVPLMGAANPDLVLKDFDGKDRRVSEFIGTGRWTVVAVWSADCPICKSEIFHMTFFHDDNRKKDAAVLGLSIDGVENRKKAQGFVTDQALNFPNLLGTPDDASLLAGTTFIGTPTYYVFSPQGKFVTQRIGPVTQDEMQALIDRLKAEQRKSG